MAADRDEDLETYVEGWLDGFRVSRESMFGSPPTSLPSPPSAPPPDSKKDKKNKKSKKDKKDKKGTKDKKTVKKSKKSTKDKKQKNDKKYKNDKKDEKDNMNSQLPGLTRLQQMQHDDHVQWEIDTKKLEAKKRDQLPGSPVQGQ